MLSKLTVANAAGEDVVLHEDTPASKRSLVDAKGLVGVGPLRESKRVRPQAHGSINETTFEEGRSVQLTGEVMSPGSIENALAEFRKISQVLLETLDGGPFLMKWTEGATGNKLQQLVTLDSECEPTLHDAAAFLDYAVTLFAADPRAYSQTLTTETGATITGTEAEQEFVKTSALFRGLAIDASHIYWVGKECIGRAALAGGTVEPEWIKGLTGIGTVSDLAVNSEFIYFISAGGIGRCKLSTPGAPENEWLKRSSIVTSLSFNALCLAIDGTFIYWGNKETIGRAKLAGTSIEKKWLVTGLEQISALAVNATNVFYTAGGSAIGRATIAGAEANDAFITGAGTVGGITLDATFVYWTNVAGNAIGRAKLAGTEVKQTFLTGLSGPARVAVNATNLFWNNSTSGFVGRSNLAGGPAGGTVTIAQAGNRPTPLTVRIHGPITNPAVVRESDGSRIALTGTITAGNYVEINTAERTVKLNGVSNLLSFLNAQNTNWLAFAPLASTKYFLTATSATAAFMDVLYRSAYA